jgi:hypothetical protein
MISIFRKIRQKLLQQNQFIRYLIYAIGEIFLVTIGILIALQVNNSNESRKARLSEHAVLKNLVQDLRADSLSFSDNLAILTKVNKLHQVLFEIGVNHKDLEIENPNLIRFVIYYNPLAIKNDPFIAGKVSDETIRKEILTYSRLLKDLDDAYVQYAELIENRIRVFLADEKVHQLSNWFENIEHTDSKLAVSVDFVDKAALAFLSKTPEFQQLLLELSIKSKTTELNIKTVLAQNERLKEVILQELNK